MRLPRKALPTFWPSALAVCPKSRKHSSWFLVSTPRLHGQHQGSGSQIDPIFHEVDRYALFFSVQAISHFLPRTLDPRLVRLSGSLESVLLKITPPRACIERGATPTFSCLESGTSCVFLRTPCSRQVDRLRIERRRARRARAASGTRDGVHLAFRL